MVVGRKGMRRGEEETKQEFIQVFPAESDLELLTTLLWWECTPHPRDTAVLRGMLREALRYEVCHSARVRHEPNRPNMVIVAIWGIRR